MFSYISGKVCSDPGITELSCISGKVYPEPWHNGSFLIFQERKVQNPGIMELFHISGNGAFYLYISLIFQEVTF